MVTVQIKLLVPICGPEGTFKSGDIAVLSEPLVKALIAAGQAEFVAREKAVIEVPETRAILPKTPLIFSPPEPIKKPFKKGK